MKVSTLARAAIVILAMGLFVQVSNAGQATWIATSQDVERQTVPSRTPTPGPITPTTPSPTDTPQPPPATDTPTPPAPVSATPTPFALTVTATPTATVQATASITSIPSVLPNAGGEPWLLWGGALLIVSGALLLIGQQIIRRRLM